jgi:hypothetical protein
MFLRAVSASLKRSAVYASFVFTKQPARIRQVLNQVRAQGRLLGCTSCSVRAVVRG